MRHAVRKFEQITDERIVAAVRRGHGRLSAAQIGRIVRMSDSNVLSRLKSCEQIERVKVSGQVRWRVRE